VVYVLQKVKIYNLGLKRGSTIGPRNRNIGKILLFLLDLPIRKSRVRSH